MRFKRHFASRESVDYTGRMIASLTAVFSHIAWYCYISIHYGSSDWAVLGSTIVLGLVGWHLGRKYDYVKYLSVKDPLTDVYNRRYVQDHFAKWSGSSDRKGDKLTLFIVDVDDFKTINDVHGHEIGDQVLRHVSKTIVRSIRKKDYVIRWGGDEFLAILPHSSSSRSESELVHQRLSNELSKELGKLLIPVSVSIGSAVYPDDGTRLDELLKSADHQLYRQKVLDPNAEAF